MPPRFPCDLAASMTANLPRFLVGLSGAAPGRSADSKTFAILAAAAWLLMLVLIAVAVRVNWGIAKRLPQWAVVVTLIAIGIVVVVAFVWNFVWLGPAALIAVMAAWVWFLARWLFPRVPEVEEKMERVLDPQRAAEEDAEQVVSAQRGVALEDVLDDVMREEHPEDLESIQEE